MMFIGKHLLPKVELDADQEIEQEVEANYFFFQIVIISRWDSARSCFGNGFGYQRRFLKWQPIIRCIGLRTDWLLD